MVLVGYWPLNESSNAAEASDHSGNENHGAINDGGDSTVPGANGILGQNTCSFDGSNDYVGIGGTSQLEFADTSVSIAAWFRTPDNSQQGKILNRGQSSAFPEGSSGYSLRFYDKYGTSFGDGSDFASVYVDNAGTVTENEWHLGVGMIDRGSQKVKLYLDGNLLGTKDASSVGSLSNPDATTDIGVLRRGSYGDNSEFFDGRLSEVRLYNHALTPAEVQYLYQVGKRGRQVTSGKSS